MPLFSLPLAAMTTWLTPIWLFSVGTTAATLILAVLFAICYAISRPAGDWVVRTVRESVMLPILGLLGLMALVTFLAAGFVPARAILASVQRFPSVGEQLKEFTIPAETQAHPIPLYFRAAELREVKFESVGTELAVDTHLRRGIEHLAPVVLKSENDFAFAWKRTHISEKPLETTTTQWEVSNLSAQPATLRISTTTDVEFPEVRSVIGVAIGVLAIFAVYLLVNALAPRVSAIALATTKESLGQPLYLLVMVLMVGLIVFGVFVPYNTFGEDIKMHKDCGLTLIMVAAIITAVWTASVSVADEIEGRTALTILSKPIQRWQFILGKYLGILWPIVLMYVILGSVLILTVGYKVVYDTRESAGGEPAWQLCYFEMVRTVPGLALGLMETMVLAAISVAISTRLPMMANLVICFSIYALGNLAPQMAASSLGKFEIVHFLAQLLATVLPVLDHLNMAPAIAGGVEVPLAYLGMAFIYCLLYSGAVMLLALTLFEDRDLA